MIYGEKQDYDVFLEKYKSQPERIEKINKSIQWLPNNRWYIPQEGDGEVEKKILFLLMTQETVPRIRMLSSTPTAVKPVEVTKYAPPAKKPPNIFGKVASFWHATTGPTTTKEEFERRLKKCIKEGGYTFAQVAGRITNIDTNKRIISIGDFDTTYPEDETPSHQVGDIVEVGQILCHGSSYKPCQYLLSQSDGKLHCGACGCGSRTHAELHTKLYYVNITCPRTPPLFTQQEAEANLAKSKASGQTPSSD